jgi:hypothetical protein
MGPNNVDLATALAKPIDRVLDGVKTQNKALAPIIGRRLYNEAMAGIGEMLQQGEIPAPPPEPPKPPPAIRKMERPDPIVIPRPPETEAERKELRAACKHQARRAGKTGKQLQLETERIYQASIAQSKSAIKIVRNQRVLIQSPESPQGERRTASGLIVRG